MISRYPRRMDKAKAALIRATEQRIAILRTVIAAVEKMGKDPKQQRLELAAEERFLAAGCPFPPSPFEGEVSSEPPPMGGAHAMSRRRD